MIKGKQKAKTSSILGLGVEFNDQRRIVVLNCVAVAHQNVIWIKLMKLINSCFHGIKIPEVHRKRKPAMLGMLWSKLVRAGYEEYSQIT